MKLLKKNITHILILLSLLSFSQRGKDGDKVVNSSEIVNEYTSLTSDASIGATTISVSNSSLNINGRFPGNLESGDLIYIIQVQGASIVSTNDESYGEVIDLNNCGNYELQQVKSVPNAGSIELDCPLKYDYTAVGKVVVVRVPRFNSLDVESSGTITGDTWDGTTGGVVVVEVKGTTTINGSIDASELGFRGGELNDNEAWWNVQHTVSSDNSRGAEKGEGIVGFQSDYDAYGGMYCRGAAANAGGGGNSHNSGGGGGANGGNINIWNGLGNPDATGAWSIAWNQESAGFSSNVSSGGGRGGYSFSAEGLDPLSNGPNDSNWGGDQRRNNGGLGGRPLDYSTGKLFLGGGGGAGDQNDDAGGVGGAGGGLVFIMSYGDVGGSGSIISNGQNGADTENSFFVAGKEGAGGAGAGGTIYVNSMGAISGVTCTADGGKGGDHLVGTFTNEAEGPGGGGSGGYIALSEAVTYTVDGGANGVSNSWQMEDFAPNGATMGGDGSFVSDLTNYEIDEVYDTICKGAQATVLAQFNGIVPPGTSIEWYDSPNGGNLMQVGNTFITSELTSDTVFYVGTCPGSYRQAYYVVIDPNAVADAGEDTLTCVGISIDLEGTGGVDYAWSPSSFLNDTTLQNPTATIDNATWFYLEIMASNGCTDRDSVFVDVTTDLPVTVSSDTVICYGDQAEITAEGGSVYSWGPLDIFDDATSSSTMASPTENGYLVVDVANDAGCTGRDSIYVQVHDEITYDISSDTTLCEGQCTIVSIDADGGGGVFNYEWDEGVGFASSFNICPDESAVYNVDINDLVTGCQLKDSVEILVSLFDWGFETDPLCAQTDLTFIDTSSSAGGNLIEWNWNFGDGTIDSGETVNHEYNIAGDYIVTLEVVDDAGCFYQSSSTITVNPLPSGTVTIPDHDGCISFPLEVSVNNSTAESYLWTVGPYTLTDQNGIINIDSVGVYDITLEMISLDGCIDTIEYNNQVQTYGNPTASFVFADSTAEYIVPGEEIMFVNHSTGGDVYFWDFNGVEYSNEFQPMFSTMVEGEACVQLVVTDDNMCTDTTEHCVTIFEDYNIIIPNVFTPNGDGFNDAWEIGGTNAYTYHLQIYDRWGVLVFETNNYQASFLGLSQKGNELSSGTYYYILIANEDSDIVEKGYFELIRE